MSLIELLENHIVDEQDKQDYYIMLRNWIIISGALKDIDSEEILLDMIKVESETRRRPDIVMRLHARLTSVRRNREREELVHYLSSKASG